MSRAFLCKLQVLSSWITSRLLVLANLPKLIRFRSRSLRDRLSASAYVLYSLQPFSSCSWAVACALQLDWAKSWYLYHCSFEHFVHHFSLASHLSCSIECFPKSQESMSFAVDDVIHIWSGYYVDWKQCKISSIEPHLCKYDRIRSDSCQQCGTCVVVGYSRNRLCIWYIIGNHVCFHRVI